MEEVNRIPKDADDVRVKGKKGDGVSNDEELRRCKVFEQAMGRCLSKKERDAHAPNATL